MRKYFIHFLIVFAFASCNFDLYNRSILRQLSNAQEEYNKSIETPLNLKVLSSLRQKVFDKLKDSLFLNRESFFFAIEAYSVEDGSYLGRFWNNRFDVRYSKKNGSELEIFSRNDTSQNVINNFFDNEAKYMCSLIEQWDINAIKKLSNASKVHGGLNYLASYIAKEDEGRYKIQCLSYYEFPLGYSHSKKP